MPLMCRLAPSTALARGAAGDPHHPVSALWEAGTDAGPDVVPPPSSGAMSKIGQIWWLGSPHLNGEGITKRQSRRMLR